MLKVNIPTPCQALWELEENFIKHDDSKTAEAQLSNMWACRKLITAGSAYWWVYGTENNFNRNSEKKVIMGVE